MAGVEMGRVGGGKRQHGTEDRESENKSTCVECLNTKKKVPPKTGAVDRHKYLVHALGEG